MFFLFNGVDVSPFLFLHVTMMSTRDGRSLTADSVVGESPRRERGLLRRRVGEDTPQNPKRRTLWALPFVGE